MRGHIAEKNGRYYPVISIKDPGTGKWRRKWLSGNKTKRKAERALAEDNVSEILPLGSLSS